MNTVPRTPRRESIWGWAAIALTPIPGLVWLGMSGLGGPWPGDSALAIVGYVVLCGFLLIPLGLLLAILGLSQSSKRHRASFGAILIAIVSIPAFLFADPRSSATALLPAIVAIVCVIYSLA